MASVHLNQLDPLDLEAQKRAFTASALQSAAFLQRGFIDPRQQHSRELDPIVGVSFTGAFTFFVRLFGINWLKWWEAGRPDRWDSESMPQTIAGRIYDVAADLFEWHESHDIEFDLDDCEFDGDIFRIVEQLYFQMWRSIVETTVWNYCDRHGLKRPNRCTTGKPEGSLSLLTGVGSCGVHVPKGWYYIRRMTFSKGDPIALAAIDYGYTVVPSQSDKDENGVLLNDPFDPRVTEWLVEVPVAEQSVQENPELEQIDLSQFSALAQLDFFMQAQKYYAGHNISSTTELREHEIEPLAERIYQAIQNDEGYISAALLARFEAKETFPRLPFEPISKDEYDRLYAQVLARRKSYDFMELLAKHDNVELSLEPMDSACGDGFCAINK